MNRHSDYQIRVRSGHRNQYAIGDIKTVRHNNAESLDDIPSEIRKLFIVTALYDDTV